MESKVFYIKYKEGNVGFKKKLDFKNSYKHIKY